MIETFQRSLPNGTTLSCRASGKPGRPLMVFLHGFPEAAFIWDELLDYFAGPRPRRLPLRGAQPARLREIQFADRGGRVQGAPADPGHPAARGHRKRRRRDGRAGRPRLGRRLRLGLRQRIPRAEVGKLVIINSPHPGTFTRELRNSPAQQQASAYMNFLPGPMPRRCSRADDFKRMWPFFTLMKAGPDGFGWLTEEVKQQYREVWSAGLTGACNLYRVTPMKPPLPGQTIRHPGAAARTLHGERADLRVLGAGRRGAAAGLLEGLEDYVPKLEVKKVPNATHWIVHEQPQLVAREIEAFLQRN
jgi:pimeloyl-ACP methyl ester carboxylesterase